MHIVVFHQYHHSPDCAATGRHYGFMARWAERHRVTLVTTDAWRHRRHGDRWPWIPPGVEARVLHVPYHNAMTVPRRLVAFGRYAAGAVWEGLRLERPDVVFGTSTPLTAAVAAALVARRHRVPWMMEVRDLWPDFPVQMGAVPAWAQPPLYALERRLYHDAARVVALSPDMAAHVRARGVPAARVTMQYNGTDLDLLAAVTDADARALRAEAGLADGTLLLYGGTFGRANAVPTLLAAAERLRHRRDLHWLFVGHGYDAARVEAAARTNPQVHVLPEQPRPRMLAWFKAADLALVPFADRPVLAANSPAKLHDALGAGTPAVVTNPGWTARLVREHGCGWAVPPEDAPALAACLDRVTADRGALSAAGARGRALARARFDRATMADQLEQHFVDLVASALRPA